MSGNKKTLHSSAEPIMSVIGSINVDQVITVQRHPQPGETLLAEGIRYTAGGKGANQAIAAAVAGATVNMIGAIGDDGYEHSALKYLRESGVRTSSIQVCPGSTGLAVIQVSEDAENSILVVPGANKYINSDYVRRYKKKIEDSAVVLLQGEIPVEGIHETIDIARAAGTRVIINLAPVVDVDPSRLLYADPLIVNEHESRLILGLHGQELSSQKYDCRDLIRALHACGYTSVVVTVGARGAYMSEYHSLQDLSEHEPILVPAPKVKAVDSTGAGDACVGALAAGLLQGYSLLEVTQRAVAYASETVQYSGAQESYIAAVERAGE